MRVPAWLDPFWHVDFEVSTPLPSEAVAAVLQPKTGRIRGRKGSDGALIVVRHSGFVNQFVRARATVVPTAAGTTVQVHIARPPIVPLFFAAAFVFLVAGSLLEVLFSALFDARRLLQSATFFVVGALIWVMVIGVNYTSAKSEAKDLRRLIGEALSAS